MADDAPPIDLMANADASGENSVDLMGDDSTIDQSGADSLMGGDGGQGAGELMGDDVLRGDLFSPKPQGDDEEDGPGAGQFDSVAAPASQFESIAAPKADEPAAEAPSTTEPAAEEEASAAAPEEAPVAVAAEPEEEEEEVLVKKKVIQPTPVLGGKNCPLPPGAIGGFRPPPPPAPEPPAAEDSVDAPSAEDSAAAPSEEASAEEEEVIKPEDYGDEHTIAALRIQNIQRGQKERAKVKEMKDKGELPGQKRVKRPQPVSKRESEKSVGEISFYDGIGSHYSGELLNGRPHGKGEYTFANGNVYKGEFRNGQMHGDGEQHFPGYGRYVAKFKDGRAIDGQFFFEDGLQYQPQGWKYCVEGDRRFYHEVVDPRFGLTDG